MSRSSSQSTQQVVTTQQTSVNVQNIIEAPKETPLQKLKMLADVVASLEGPKAETPQPILTAVTVENPDPLAFFKEPQTLIWIGAGILGVVLIAKKV